MPDVALKVNGRLYAGWESVRVQRSMEQISGSFSLGVTDRWTADRTPMPIRPGDRCQVLIGNETLIDGYVDDRNVDYDRESHRITITGRDLTGDLVDCSASIRQTRGQKLDAIAREVCKPFGIDVQVDVDTGAAFKDEYAEPGQTAFDLLSTLASHRGVLLMSDAGGVLRITGEKSRRVGTEIVFGKNIEACQARDSWRDRHSVYTAMHQPAQSDLNFGSTATEAKAVATDGGISRRRPLVMLVDDGGDLDARAKIERNVRAGRSRSIIYTVSGWTMADGSLWQPNWRVSVTDPHQSPALHHELMLITAVTQIRDAQGTRTELTLMRPGAFDVYAEPEQDPGGWA